MQLTENKMNEVVNGGTAKGGALSAADASAIGNLFVREFYTCLSQNPSEAHRYYGHESFFQFDDKSAVGQQNIAKVLEEVHPPAKKMKILSIKGNPTCNQGIVLQVCGEMNDRRFLQTFILGQQGAKKYYVQNDFLQFVDVAFASPTKTNEPKQQKKLNNGHATSRAPKAESPERVKPAPVQEKTPVKPPTPQQPARKQSNQTEERAAKSHSNKEHPPKQVKELVTETVKPVQHVAPAPEPHPVEQRQKTWANLVGGGSKNNVAPPSYAIHPQQNNHQQASANNGPQKQEQRQNNHYKERNNQQNQGFSSSSNNTSDRKIYLGGIVRNIVPDSTATAETEIKTLFYNYAPVESVSIPRKVLDSPNDTSRHAFAFITMRHPDGAKQVFDAAEKDESGNYRLNLKIDAFGFDGSVTISEQKPPLGNGGGGFRGRGGFQSRGGFPNRGRGGSSSNGGRGGFRNFHNQQHQGVAQSVHN